MTRALAIAAALTTTLMAAETRSVPPLELHTASGAAVRLAELKGRVVLIDFWASWCGPCERSFPALDALYREWHARGFDVVAINLDEHRKDADRFLDKHTHEMPVVFDPRGESPRAFDVQGMPTSILVDRSGTIRFVHMGYTDKTIATMREEIARLLGEG
jgi:thiol-disulfide isomerase/thioredoxin